VWPLLPLACVVNNWIEVRSDAAKICTSQRRPVPHRADSIGPWLDNIAFLSWLGSLTTWTLVYFFRGDHVTDLNQTMMLYLLITILVVERSYWIVDRFVGKWSQKIKTAGELNLMKEEYRLRRTMSIDLDTQKHEQVHLTGTSIVQSPVLEQMHVTDLELRRIVDDAKDLLTSGLKAEK
jgi:anoctamin-10